MLEFNEKLIGVVHDKFGENTKMIRTGCFDHLYLAVFDPAGIGTVDPDLLILAERVSPVFPAAYTTIESDYQPDTKKVGTVLYAAGGEAEDGRKVVALKVKGAARATQKDSRMWTFSGSTPGAHSLTTAPGIW